MKRALFIVALVSFSFSLSSRGSGLEATSHHHHRAWGAGGSTDQIVRLMAGVWSPSWDRRSLWSTRPAHPAR